RPSKGVHLVVSNDKLRIDGAVAIPKTASGHYLWIAPWQGRTIIGTTDTEYEGDLDQPVASAQDVRTLLDAVEEWFPEAHLSETDIIATYAGLRPLPMSNASSTAAIARDMFIEQRGNV